jgi:hypothetical protein
MTEEKTMPKTEDPFALVLKVAFDVAAACETATPYQTSDRSAALRTTVLDGMSVSPTLDAAEQAP